MRTLRLRLLLLLLCCAQQHRVVAASASSATEGGAQTCPSGFEPDGEDRCRAAGGTVANLDPYALEDFVLRHQVSCARCMELCTRHVSARSCPLLLRPLANRTKPGTG